MLEIHDLAKLSYDQENSKSPYTFAGISAHMQQGERISLIGASGQGKSTLLRTLALLNTPDEGDMIYERASFREVGPRHWRKQICYVAQQAVMLPGSIEDNLCVASRLHGQPFDRKLADQLLEASGLEHLDIKKQASDMSGGEMQRIALIRSMLLRPGVLLLDEVTSSLDTISTRAVEKLLQGWHASEGTTLIWVTHELEQAARTSDRVWYMSSNTILEDAPTAEFFRKPATESARTFIQYNENEVQP
ncbi:ABC transporter ATP-binding protein [Paenibacillus planticolens]|uniref:ATP-binding cassette domain-containing protein n=1 Tax=Paenibacillus planticolens TaxID=2654976 RepID=A0ABX1ZV19_9BACL|nr:ATP-binding cassette domain-containing protein [Paenibacillus planticolens]NOV03869.1 ATP-binding cassette domain-containing protein [Paenibacillus planticolens]